MITDNNEIKRWLYLRGISTTKYKIRADGTIDVDGDVNLMGGPIDKKLPVKFGIVTGDFNISETGVTSLEGCPYEVGDSFVCRENNLSSLEFCPRKVGYGITSTSNPIKSLVGVADLIDSVGGHMFLDYDAVEEGGLGLIMIPGAKSLWRCDDHPAFVIINSYLNQPDKVFECQQELIDAGLEEYAVL